VCALGNVGRGSFGTSSSGGGGAIVVLILGIVIVRYLWVEGLPWLGHLFSGDSSSSSGGPPPPPPNPSAFRVPLPSCLIQNSSQKPPGDCSTGYITSQSLYEDLSSCRSTSSAALCYAEAFRQLESRPLVIVYPQENAAPYRNQLHGEMIAGVKSIGEAWEERSRSGEPNVRSVDEIRSMVKNAISEVDDIDQPVDETTDQQLRRLGIGYSIGALATLK
jgi:hypothetical protein